MDDGELSTEFLSNSGSTQKTASNCCNNSRLCVACTYIINPSSRAVLRMHIGPLGKCFSHAPMVLPVAERERENRCKESPIFCTIAVKLNAGIKKQQRNICINIFPTWITLESASALGWFRYSSRWGVCARRQWKN